jgi:transposase InsO family protein
MKKLSDIALFRLSVLGPLTSRIDLSRGEIKSIINQQAQKAYDIPNSKRTKISHRTIEKWYYQWKKFGVESLENKPKSNKGETRLSIAVQNRILELKKDHMGRSIAMIIKMLYQEGHVAAHSTVHRFLKANQLSSRVLSDAPTIERRKFEAKHANDIWYSDVMHGPVINEQGKERKLYLVSLMDDASRLITHSSFCFDESANSIEYVLQQAILKRGIPKRLIVDNGAAYIAKTLKSICARLGIHLIYCRPYEPEGKGKIERWHRTIREQFIQELSPQINTQYEINSHLWAWINEYYHKSPHKGLNGQSPLTRYSQDLEVIQSMKMPIGEFEKIFYHRIKRKVNKDATISINRQLYEVPYELSGKSITVAIMPSTNKPICIEDNDYNEIGYVSILNAHGNLDCKRQRPDAITKNTKTTESFTQMIKQQQRNNLSLEDE